MGVMTVNWSQAGLTGLGGLRDAIAALPLAGAVTVMVHGYRFDPDDPQRSPHNHILALRPRPGCWKAISWPRHLHLDRPDRLGIAFGWPATGRLGPVAARAFRVGEGLAVLLGEIAKARPDLHVCLIAHSLGARVALRALQLAPTHGVHHMILLSGAEYRGHARTALASPAGRGAHVINVRSTENLPFDLAFRASVVAPNLTSLPLSAGLADAPNWTDLSLHCGHTRAALNRLGHRIPAPATRFCHWSGYLRPGLFPLYRRLLDPSETRLIAALREAVIRPARPANGGATTALSPL